MHVYIYIYIYIFVSSRFTIFSSTFVRYAFAFAYTHVYICIYTYMELCICIYIHLYRDLLFFQACSSDMLLLIHTCVYIYMRVYVSYIYNQLFLLFFYKGVCQLCLWLYTYMCVRECICIIHTYAHACLQALIDNGHPPVEIDDVSLYVCIFIYTNNTHTHTHTHACMLAGAY